MIDCNMQATKARWRDFVLEELTFSSVRIPPLVALRVFFPHIQMYKETKRYQNASAMYRPASETPLGTTVRALDCQRAVCNFPFCIFSVSFCMFSVPVCNRSISFLHLSFLRDNYIELNFWAEFVFAHVRMHVSIYVCALLLGSDVCSKAAHGETRILDPPLSLWHNLMHNLCDSTHPYVESRFARTRRSCICFSHMPSVQHKM
jgi:hypothetical protein